MSTISIIASVLAVLAAYLIGAIPFGFLIFYRVKKVDIRTVGSGNIGATNVGRNLGFRYFVLVFLLDMLKGLLPTLLIPRAVEVLFGAAPPDLRVLVALATIIGHNFPVYLGFKGGKGVATSLGAVAALDPAASLAAVLGFGTSLAVTSYVSLSSIVGGVTFAMAHFVLVEEPWSAEHRGVGILTIALLVLLVVRHRKNILRILNRTEPKVMLRKPKNGPGTKTPKDESKTPPSGRVVTIALFALVPISAIVLVGTWIARNATAPIEVKGGAWTFREVDRVSTGLQRAERIQFSDDGKFLAVSCPRYLKCALYRVETSDRLERVATIDLDGRPVGMVAGVDRFVVLVRPSGDRCHLEEGWLEAFDHEGKRIGPKVPAGDYPDDLAFNPDRKTLYVLSSGSGEGNKKKPAPRLQVFRENASRDGYVAGARVELKPDDDPVRIQISRLGDVAVVSRHKSDKASAFDITDPEHPRMIEESSVPKSKTPTLSLFPENRNAIILPADTESEAVTMDLYGRKASKEVYPFLAATRTDDSTVEISQPSPQKVIAQFPVRGKLNLGKGHPSGIAYSESRNLLAVATRSGAIHLVAVESELDAPAPASAVAGAAVSSGVTR